MKTNFQSNSRNYRLCFVALMIALFSISAVNGSTIYYARVNGDWNINTTWSLTPGGPAIAPGLYPLAGDDVYIGEGAVTRSVTIPAAFTAQCANIYLGSAGTGSSVTLQFSTFSSALQVSGNVIVYGPNAIANRSINVNAGTMTIAGNLELGSGQAGTNADRVCRVVINSGTVTVTGNLVYHHVAGSSPAQTLLNMSGGAGLFNLAGLFTVGNNLGTLTPGTQSTFNFNGTSVTQVIPSGISNIVFNHVRCNNTSGGGGGGGAVLAGDFTASNITGDLSVESGLLSNGGYAITLAPGMDFTVANDATFRLLNLSGMAVTSGGGIKTFGVTSLVDYAGTNQSVSSETYGNLAFNNTGTKTLLGTTILKGYWSDNSTVDAFTNATAVVFSGTTGSQDIGGSSATSFFDLEINNPSGVEFAGLVKNVTNTLTLTNGIVDNGALDLIVSNPSTGAIVGGSAGSYINGILVRSIAAGANTYVFPIGTTAAYTPVSIDFATTTEPGEIIAYSSAGDHWNISGSIIYPGRTVNRIWSLIPSGLGTFLYDATFNWVSADQDVDFDYTEAYAGKWNGTTWAYPAMGTITATSAQITGETSFSDFQVGNSCETPPSAYLSGDTAVCQTGNTATLRVDLTGTPPWQFTWTDGVNTTTVTDVMTTPYYFNVSTGENTTYSITMVGDATGCNAFGSGSAFVSMGPVTTLPNVLACAGHLIQLPVKVMNFDNVGALSLTVNYNKSVMTYDSYSDTHGFIDYVYCDETGSTGIVRISGIEDVSFIPPSDSILLTLRFNFIGGNTAVTFDDLGEDTKCEYATGAPDFIPYCDNPATYYYRAGSVTEATVATGFSADDTTPPTHFTVQFTATTPGATSWEWSFDRETEVQYVGGTTAASQNPQVQFTRGGPYTVTLTASNATCTDTETKTAYIWAGTPGLWTGNTSTAWYTSTNWDDYRVPDETVDVLIPSEPEGDRYPYVPGDLETNNNCLDIRIEGPAEITVEGEFIVQPGTNVIITGTGQVVMHFVP